ncbi:MAG TPA: hypothetical protein PL041_10545 [Melioribacteraceae bacterium]|nr:hypothetical protein [Melioribacteraceae bacterium]
MELVPIISTILLYTTGFLIVVVLISNIVKRVFIVKTDIPQIRAESKVVTKITTKQNDRTRKRKKTEEKQTETVNPDVKNKYKLTSVGEEYSKNEQRKKRERKREEEKKERNNRYSVVNKNLREENYFYVAKYYSANKSFIKPDYEKTNYRAE